MVARLVEPNSSANFEAELTGPSVVAPFLRVDYEPLALVSLILRIQDIYTYVFKICSEEQVDK